MTTSLSDLLLNSVIAYGAPVFGLALLLSGLGLPLPASLLVVAAGAFTRQGVLDIPSAGGLGLLGVVLGDTLSYLAGRFARGPVERRFAGSSAWISAEETFRRRGGLAVYLTRFLLTPLALPTNLIAGSSGYSLARFVSYDLGGEFTWIALYGFLGYLFGTEWEYISQFISDSSGLLAGVALLAGAVYLLLRRLKRNGI